MKIRQIALVAEELAPVKDTLFELLGLDDAFVDAGVGEFGLHNIVMTIGTTFLEVVSPTREDTTAGRLLQRRGGDGGYMVIVQVDELAPESARLDEVGIRKVFEADIGKAKVIHLHPKDVPGAIASLDQMTPPESWAWAGADWHTRAARHVSAICGAQVQSADPADTARKWSLAYNLPVTDREGTPTLQFDGGELRFVPDLNGRGNGLQGLDLQTTDMAAIEAAAQRLSLPLKNGSVTVCGTVFNFK